MTKILPYKPSIILSTQDLVDNAKADFLETVDKQDEVEVQELSHEMLTHKDKFLKDLYIAVDRGKKETHGDFYVEVIIKVERLRRKTIHRQFIWTLVLSTPRPGSSQYKYTRSTGTLELLWDLPVRRACEWIRDNKVLLPLEYTPLVKTVIEYYDGTLLNKANELNGKIN